MGSRVQGKALRKLFLKQWKIYSSSRRILKAQNSSKKFLKSLRCVLWTSHHKTSPYHAPSQCITVPDSCSAHCLSLPHPNSVPKDGTNMENKAPWLGWWGFTMTHGKDTEIAGTRGSWSILQTDRQHHSILFRKVKLLPGRNTQRRRWRRAERRRGGRGKSGREREE